MAIQRDPNSIATVFEVFSAGQVGPERVDLQSGKADGDTYHARLHRGYVHGEPASPAGVFIQSNWVVHLGPDQVVNFHCYRSNAVTLELGAPGVHRVVFAGEAARTFRLMGSLDMTNWLPLQTNVMTASEIFGHQEADLRSPAQRFSKVLSP